mmetsp:Transcript_12941/g.29300  ORF Transcript_12941/g.29300 Transcript_12941/m.29300 type:complete len:168 (-) Transcript_12941:83-586(-)
MYLGPLKNGTYIKTMAKSIHVAQTSVDQAWAGHSACFAVNLTKAQRKMLTHHQTKKKGMVLLGQEPTAPVYGFTAEICLSKGDSTFIKGQTNSTIHILHVKTACRLVDFDTMAGNGTTVVLRPGQRATATFEFLQGPQHVRKGMRVILRDGHVRGIGIIRALHHHKF